MTTRPVTLDVPQGAVANNTTVTLSKTEVTEIPQAFPIAGTAFTSSPASFAQPVTITIDFSAFNLPPADVDNLAVFKLANGQWIELTTTIQKPSSLAMAETNSLTSFVLARKVVRSKWTVIVFMNAANDLSQFSKLNFNQMEKVASNPDLRFVVQWKQAPELGFPTQFNGTRRYLVRHDETDQINSKILQEMGTAVDMGQVSTLRQFVNWTKQEFPADRYALIIWNHGNGWQRKPTDDDITRGVSYDDQTGHAIQTWELEQAMQGLGIEVLAFDASLMQMIEVAYEMRNQVPFIVGSEESPPGEGYPYDLVFAPWRDNPSASTRTLTKSFVDGMLAYPPYESRKITESVLDSSKLDGVAAACSTLATTLMAHPELSDQIKTARAQTKGFSVTSFRAYLDLIGFCQELSTLVTNPEVVAACQAVITATEDAIVWEGHNQVSAKSHGLSIDLSTSTQFSRVATSYQNLQWAMNTTWDEWLAVSP
jgi:hypothetical protein